LRPFYLLLHMYLGLQVRHPLHIQSPNAGMKGSEAPQIIDLLLCHLFAYPMGAARMDWPRRRAPVRPLKQSHMPFQRPRMPPAW
jgi:hypothetical protein